MSFHLASWRDRPRGGIGRPTSRARNKSPSVQAALPPVLFDRLCDEAEARGVPLSRLVREALAAKYLPPEKAP